MREIIDELDGITATSNDNDTIVIIINPKGVSTPIMANMVESNLPNLEVKPDATDSGWLKENWVKNTDKWLAAKEVANKNNMKFIIVTEKFFL